MRCVLLCMLEAVEGRLGLLEVLGAFEVQEAPEVIRCVLLCMLEAVEGKLCLLEVPNVMLCVLGTLYAGGCGLGSVFGVSKFLLWQFSCYSPPPYRAWHSFPQPSLDVDMKTNR